MVRAFVAVIDERSFSAASARLGISQQAVSKRVAKLESDLGVRLLSRSSAGTGPTADGVAFLHHARALVGIADQAVEALRGRRHTLRIDVLDTRLRSIDLVREFHESLDDVHVDVVTSIGLRSARGALAHGSIDAAFVRAGAHLEEDLRYVPAYLEPVHLLISRDHPLAGRRAVAAGELSGSTVWMPGNAADSEWGDYYRVLGDTFGITIDDSGPDFGWEYFVGEIGAGKRAGFVGERLRMPWHPRTVQVPVVDPVPVYPCSLLYHRQNRHPLLAALIEFVRGRHRPFDPARQWLPEADRALFAMP